jgi:hypothetical protein
MDDELESLLREHYGRSAQTIHPDPGLAARLRSAGRPRRRLRFPGRLALAAAVAVAVVGVAWAELGGGGDRAEPAAVQAQRVVITINGTAILDTGSYEEVTGSVRPGGTVDLAVQSQRNSAWVTAATVTAESGRYRVRVSLAGGTTALRVCTQAAPISCSSPLLLPQNTPSPIASSPVVAPTSSPRPSTMSPSSAAPPPPSPRRRPSRTPSPAITGH